MNRPAVAAVLSVLVLGGCARGSDAPAAQSPATRPTSGATPAATARLPAGIEMFPTGDSGVASCGDAKVTWILAEEGGEESTLTAEKAGRTVLFVRGSDEFERIVPTWCGDVNADGSLEIGSERYTGGAHCCTSLRIDTVDGPTLLDIGLGNAGGADPEQLDDTDPLEIVTNSDSLAYFSHLPYAASPTLPRVFAVREGKYVDAVTDFTDHIRGSLKEADDDLATSLEKDEATEDELKGLALGVFGHHVLLGDQVDALDEIAADLPDEIADWLREYADTATKQVRNSPGYGGAK